MNAPTHLDSRPESLAWKSRVELLAIIGALHARVAELSGSTESGTDLTVVPDAEAAESSPAAAAPPGHDQQQVGEGESGTEVGSYALWADELDEALIYDWGPPGVPSGLVDPDEVDLDQAVATPPRGDYLYLGADGWAIPARWEL